MCCESRVYSGCARLRLERRRTATAIHQVVRVIVLEVGGGLSAQQQYKFLGDKALYDRLSASAASLGPSPGRARNSFEPGRKKDSRQQTADSRQQLAALLITAVLVDRRVSECIYNIVLVLERIYQVFGS